MKLQDNSEIGGKKDWMSVRPGCLTSEGVSLTAQRMSGRCVVEGTYATQHVEKHVHFSA